MKFRKLRIAWSVVWGVVAVLVIVLWVGSYWRQDVIFRVTNGHRDQIMSRVGRVYFDRVVESGTAQRFQTSAIVDTSTLVNNPDFHFLGFAYRRLLMSSTLVVPYWMLCVASALIGASIWYRGRFTVRTPLIVTTLIAVVLGLIVWLGN